MKIPDLDIKQVEHLTVIITFLLFIMGHKSRQQLIPGERSQTIGLLAFKTICLFMHFSFHWNQDHESSLFVELASSEFPPSISVL